MPAECLGISYFQLIGDIIILFAWEDKKYSWIEILRMTKEKNTNVEYSNGYTEGSNQRIVMKSERKVK